MTAPTTHAALRFEHHPRRSARRHAAPLPSVGYDIYWRFAAARQLRYRDRLGIGTDSQVFGVQNAVIDRHRFTNAYRVSDRVSQYLLTEVMYDTVRPWRDVFTRTLLFKFFNRIDTWRWLHEHLGDIDTPAVLGPDVEQALTELAAARPVYSAAYIMPPPMNRAGPKFLRHLGLLRDMIRQRVPERVAEAADLRQVYEILVGHEGIGPFLAYQYATDLNYAPELCHSEDRFVMAGPGAKRGLRKCFTSRVNLSDSDLIRWVVDQQETEFADRDLPWHDLWGRPLQLIDAQNLFCEVDKYTRVAHPELSEFAAGTRIKQIYRPATEPMTAWFPPKWGINSAVSTSLAAATGESGPADCRQMLF